MNIQVREAALVSVGETALVDGDTRSVVSILKSNTGAQVIIWRGAKAEGGCMPVVWKEWREGKPQHKRRDW